MTGTLSRVPRSILVLQFSVTAPRLVFLLIRFSSTSALVAQDNVSETPSRSVLLKYRPVRAVRCSKFVTTGMIALLSPPQRPELLSGDRRPLSIVAGAHSLGCRVVRRTYTFKKSQQVSLDRSIRDGPFCSVFQFHKCASVTTWIVTSVPTLFLRHLIRPWISLDGIDARNVVIALLIANPRIMHHRLMFLAHR